MVAAMRTGRHGRRAVSLSFLLVATFASLPRGAQAGPATAADLQYPQGVTVDGDGSVYIADSGNNRVRMVDPFGNISTVAGTGERGHSGDGGPAVAARLDYPTGVAVDQLGSLYIADGGNHRVRKVDPSGIITTIAGNGIEGFSGDGGPATEAVMNKPSDVAVDGADNLYIADKINSRIRKIDASGIISTVAGGFSVEDDPLAQVYYATGSNVRDGGKATEARLGYPKGVSVDALGTMFIADSGDNRIRKVDPSGTISTILGTGLAAYWGDGLQGTLASVNGPSGITTDAAGNVYIGDRVNHRVRKIDTNGIVTTIAGLGVPTYSGDGGPATLASLNGPASVALDDAGNLYIADYLNHRIRKVAPDGIIITIAGTGRPGYSGDS